MTVEGVFGIDGFFILVGGVRHKLDFVTLLTLLLNSLKTQPKLICGASGTLLNPRKVFLNSLLTLYGSLKTCCKVGNFLVEFHILLTGLEALVLERNTRNTRWWSDRVLRLSPACSPKLLDHE